MVCNTDKTDSFTDGQVVRVRYKKIVKCTGAASNAIICAMEHMNEGWIQVMQITAN
jgi:alkyl hydroperoxide reductase subunit AhpF